MTSTFCCPKYEPARGALAFMLLLLAGCSSAPIDQIDLMPAPEVYGDGAINLLPEHDPIEAIPYQGILYATDREQATPESKEKYYLNDRGDFLRVGVAKIELGEKELGKQWDKEIHALNQQASVVLRTNTLKTTKKNLHKALLEEEIGSEFLEGYPDALKLIERKNVFRTEAFKKGFFEVQDASSQLVAEYLDVQPGMRVIDACAGASVAFDLSAQASNDGLNSASCGIDGDDGAWISFTPTTETTLTITMTSYNTCFFCGRADPTGAR